MPNRKTQTSEAFPGPSRSRPEDCLQPNGAWEAEELPTVRAKILKQIREARILEPLLFRDFVRDRQERDIDQHDEVWEGVYVVPPLANLPHQRLVTGLTAIFHDAIGLTGRGQVFAGANVSDRPTGWEKNYRDPDVVVVLKGGRAIDCFTHLLGGPDFLVEIESKDGEAEAKIPFYSHVQVHELLIVQRDSRGLRLYRHDGRELVLVGTSNADAPVWLKSEVIPFAFRWKSTPAGPATEVKRLDKKGKTWTI